jgi:hypothetical protein
LFRTGQGQVVRLVDSSEPCDSHCDGRGEEAAQHFYREPSPPRGFCLRRMMKTSQTELQCIALIAA